MRLYGLILDSASPSTGAIRGDRRDRTGQFQDRVPQSEIIRNPTDPEANTINQKLKVLPLKWFYGGKEPASNPSLKEAYEPAKP